MTRARVLAAWTATRTLLFVLLFLPGTGGPVLFGDMALYARWGRGIADWSRVPYRDFGWEYPPGAAAVVTPPAFFGDLYPAVFLLLMVLADLAVVFVLLALAGRLGSARGVWLWLAGTTLMGPIVLTRYDTVSALLALLAVLGIAAGAPLAAGLALGGGVVTKLWPALLLAVAPLVAGARRLTAACAATVAVSVAALLAVGGAAYGHETVERHLARGLQVEAVAATPVVVAQRLGAAVEISLPGTSGSWDVTGTGVGVALAAATALTLAALGLAAVLVARARRVPEAWPDVAAAVLLLVTVSGKVLSPQYVVWLLALLAAALCRPGSALARPAWLVAGSAVLGQVVYPAYYDDLVDGSGVTVVVALAVRNVALLAAAALAVRGVWRATR